MAAFNNNYFVGGGAKELVKKMYEEPYGKIE